jgi:MoxR-like ATPase
VPLSISGTKKTIWHLFDVRDVNAINTAIACQRPLLLTGEPGVGKTQLARAAAKSLKRAFVRYTVDSKTESRDLLWQFDAIARLAQAQLAHGLGWGEAKCEQELAVAKYIRPGPLWWGLNWQTAAAQPGATPPVQHEDDACASNGVVVLIDEIDKAEIDVPNGLLEALGEGSFHPDGLPDPVHQGKIPPFIVITSNRERSLPAAFVRRCVVLHMRLPPEDDGLHDWLVKRGQAHSDLPDEILERAADMLLEDRKAIKKPPRPGQAEYLDLLRAIEEQAGSGLSHDTLLKRVRPYILKKSESV